MVCELVIVSHNSGSILDVVGPVENISVISGIVLVVIGHMVSDVVIVHGVGDSVKVLGLDETNNLHTLKSCEVQVVEILHLVNRGALVEVVGSDHSSSKNSVTILDFGNIVVLIVLVRLLMVIVVYLLVHLMLNIMNIVRCRLVSSATHFFNK